VWIEYNARGTTNTTTKIIDAAAGNAEDTRRARGVTVFALQVSSRSDVVILVSLRGVSNGSFLDDGPTRHDN
jgi:hypothetical protein